MKKKDNENPIVVVDNREKRRIRARKRARKRKIVTALAIIAALLAGYAAGRYQYLVKEAFAGEKVDAKNQNTDIVQDTSAMEQVQGSQTESAELSGYDPAYEPAELVDYGVEVQAPVDYSLYEALKVIRSREDVDERYSEILEDPSIYPEKMLINLANNPEELDFVYNYPQDSSDSSHAVLSAEELTGKCPLFLQWDRRWGYLAYGYEDEKKDGENVDSNIAISGCGPTALAMVIVGLTGDTSVTPATVADYAMNNGHYMNGTGTAWSLMLEGAEAFGLTSERSGINPTTMKKELDKGAFLIFSMQQGDFTTGGHFIVVYGYDENGFYINDPNCVARSHVQWTYDQLAGQIKGVWSLKKGA